MCLREFGGGYQTPGMLPRRKSVLTQLGTQVSFTLLQKQLLDGGFGGGGECWGCRSHLHQLCTTVKMAPLNLRLSMQQQPQLIRKGRTLHHIHTAWEWKMGVVS